MLLFQLIYFVLFKLSPLTRETIINNTPSSMSVLLLLLVLGIGAVYGFIFIYIPIELTEKIYKRYFPESEFTQRVVLDGGDRNGNNNTN